MRRVRLSPSSAYSGSRSCFSRANRTVSLSTSAAPRHLCNASSAMPMWQQSFAIEVKRAVRLRHPVEVGTLGDFTVPQSYRYLDVAKFDRVLARGSRRAA